MVLSKSAFARWNSALLSRPEKPQGVYRMNRATLLIALALCLPLTARADDASLHAKAKELVTLLHTDRMVGQLSENLKKRTSDAAEKAIGPNPTLDTRAKLAEFDKKVSETVEAQIGWQALEPSFIDIYAKTFNEDELNSIIAFYKSPAGIAFLDKTPAVNAQIRDITSSRVSAVQSQLNQSYEEFRKSLPPASPPPPSK
jgi:uncharacterized protein